MPASKNRKDNLTIGNLITYERQDLTQVSGSNGEVGLHDGSGSLAEGMAVYIESQGEWVSLVVNDAFWA